MAFFDRFKSQKEKELKGLASEPTKETAKTEVKKEKKPAGKKAKGAAVISSDLVRVISKPLVTEKAATLASKGQYVFVVAQGANRVHVRAAVKAMYGVTPVSVNIQRVRGKAVRFGRISGQRKSWKKAIVTLPKGKTIDVYEGV